MTTLRQQILALISDYPGLTDREITNKLKSQHAHQQTVNRACQALEQVGVLMRKTRSNDGLIGNYQVPAKPAPESSPPPSSGPAVAPGVVPPSEPLYEMPVVKRIRQPDIRAAIETWLGESGWSVTIPWENQRGLDIEATKSGAKWVIQARGQGKDNPMGRHYFPIVLGEIVNKMDNPKTKYSLAFPEVEPFLGMWRMLPQVAKSRLGVTVLFVGASGHITEVR